MKYTYAQISDEIHKYGVMDIGMVQAIVSFVQFGWDPGSFGRALLQDDLPGMLRCKHELLGTEVIGNMREFVQSAPSIAVKLDWKGFYYESPEHQMAFRLQANGVWNYLTDESRKPHKIG